MFEYYNHLGFHTKYYIRINNEIKLYNSFEEAIQKVDNKKVDATSIIEFVNRFYFFGDRTIIENLYHTPWLAKLEKNKWCFDKIEDKSLSITSVEEFSELFLMYVEKEILNYIKNYKNIGILLSGGMDSRIVAMILNKLNKEKKLNLNITAITWGEENSRDVIYAKQIANYYNWDFKYFPITVDTLRKNIILTSKYGCEFSPVHLHAMEDVSNIQKIDLILAGSFGDSIGRAEYSSVHASKLKSIGSHIVNKFFLIKPSLFKQNIKNVKKDLEIYYNRFPRKNKYSLYELERQIHYMRKELNVCMNVINEKIPLYQVFTSPQVYKLVFNTPLKFRNDRLYYILLKKYDEFLLEIPWARTGQIYLSNQKKALDNFKKDYHSYGKWIKNDLSSFIEDKLFNGNIEKLNLFNMESIKNMYYYNKKYGTDKLNRVDELLVWLVSLSYLIENYKLKGIDDRKIKDFNKIIDIKSKITLISYFYAIRILK